jgi:hypothetical protein
MLNSDKQRALSDWSESQKTLLHVQQILAKEEAVSGRLREEVLELKGKLDTITHERNMSLAEKEVLKVLRLHLMIVS